MYYIIKYKSNSCAIESWSELISARCVCDAAVARTADNTWPHARNTVYIRRRQNLNLQDSRSESVYILSNAAETVILCHHVRKSVDIDLGMLE